MQLHLKLFIRLAYYFMLTKISSKEGYPHTGVEVSLKKYRHPTLKEQRRMDVRLQIDQVLRQDIQYLRYNLYQPSSQHKLEVTKQNNLINEYVHNNYEEYDLLNPLPHLSTQIFTRSQVQESRKRTKKLQVYSSSKKKQPNESGYRPQEQKKQKFKTEPNITIQEFKYQPTKRIATIQNLQKYDRGSRKTNLSFVYSSRSTNKILSTHPTQQRIQQSGHRLYPSEFSIKIEQPPTYEQSMIESRYINEGVHPRFSFSREKESQSPHFKEQKEINPFMKVELKEKSPQLYSERFRYCVGCEKSLLEINIDHHQSTCAQFKNAFLMSYEQLVDYLGTKIEKIQKQILNNTHQHNQGAFQRQLNQLVQASSQSKKLGFRTGQFLKDFRKLNESRRMEWQQLQRISRLNWFLQIYQNIRKKLKI